MWLLSLRQAHLAMKPRTARSTVHHWDGAQVGLPAQQQFWMCARVAQIKVWSCFCPCSPYVDRTTASTSHSLPGFQDTKVSVPSSSFTLTGNQSPMLVRKTPSCCLRSLNESPLYTRYSLNLSFQTLWVWILNFSFWPILLLQLPPSGLQRSQLSNHREPLI